MIKQIFCILFISIYFTGNSHLIFDQLRVTYYNNSKSDYFDEILKRERGEAVEYGVSTSFKINSKVVEECSRILENLEVKESEREIHKSDNWYEIEFEAAAIKGTISGTSEKGENFISLNITESGCKNNLRELKQKVSKITGRDEKEIKFYEFLKIKLPQGELAEINKGLCAFLKTKGALNIETVEINNGFSTVAYTKNFYLVKNNGKAYDFNFALCNYPSGKYLILGTPEIFTSY